MIRHLAILAALAGCASEGDDSVLPDAQPVDSGVTDTGVQACRIEAPADLTLAVGTRGSVDVGGEGWTALTIENLAQGWSATVDGSTIDIRASYTEGPASLDIVAACADRSERASLSLTATPLVFEQIDPWVQDDTGPLGREYFSIIMDPTVADRLWLFGGFHYRPRQFTPGHDVWSLDLTTNVWARHTDAPIRSFPGGTIAAHPDGWMMRYGGLNGGEVPNERDTPFVLLRVETGTAGLSFAEVVPDPAQQVGDYQPAFFFHPPTNKFYAICGLNDFEGSHCNVRSFDPDTNAWSEELVEGDSPPGRNGHFWSYDASTERFVVFSGEGYPPSADCANCLHDTWTLDLTASPFRWTQIALDTPNIGRRNGAYALDPIHHRMLVFGGTNNGRTTHPGLWALDLTPGEERWFEVPTSGGAPVRTSGAAVFDATRNRILVGFGNGDAGVHADLWAIGL